MTGLLPATIRKWQERFKILKPARLQNGYWCYSTEDYFILKSIQQRLNDQQSLREIMQMGRQALLQDAVPVISEDNREFIRLIQSHSYDQIEKQFEKGKRGTLSSWITHVIRPHVVLVGKAWEAGLISVAEEHGFTQWLHGLLMRHVKHPAQKGGWLCVTFPGDPHQLSSLMHYCVLRSRSVPAWFCGSLPKEMLIKEIQSGKYRGVAISVVLHQSATRRQQLAQVLEKASPGIRVVFGGFALKH